MLSLRLGAWWYTFVARPIFIALVLIWLWRLMVLAVLLFRISRLGLDLVPTHPDRDGGLGFLGELPHAFSPLTLALASVLAAQWGHHAVYHGVELRSFALPLGACALVAATVRCWCSRGSSRRYGGRRSSTTARSSGNTADS